VALALDRRVRDVCAAAAALRKLLWARAALHRLRASLLQLCMMASRQGVGRPINVVSSVDMFGSACSMCMIGGGRAKVSLCAQQL
jgi:hypothetical protein